MGEHRLCCGKRQRVTDEGASEEGHADLRERIVTILPETAIEGVHVFPRASDDTDGQSATDHFAVRGDVRLHTKPRLGAAGVAPETGDGFIED